MKKQYINKANVIAEIEKLKDEAKIHPSDFGCGRLSICKELMNFLDTLEVKEVDLEKEFDKCCEDYTFDDEWDVYIARHFFKLGFQKAQKGE